MHSSVKIRIILMIATLAIGLVFSFKMQHGSR